MIINPLYLLSGLGMIAVALSFILLWYYAKKISFTIFLWGGLAWIIAVLLKTFGSFFISKNLIIFLREHLPKFLSEPTIWIYVGLMTGVFECGVVLLFCLLKRIREADFNEAVGFGIGFGGIEAFLLGLNLFISALLLLIMPNFLSQDTIKNLSQSFTSPFLIPTPVIERFSAILIHTFSSTLIILSFKKRRFGWFWLSFLYKTFVDGLAGYFLFSKVETAYSQILQHYIVELYFFILGLIGLFGTISIKKLFN